MPIFEYRCKNCGHRFDALVRNSGEKISCESCGNQEVVRLISTFAVRSDDRSNSASSCPTGTCPLA